MDFNELIEEIRSRIDIVDLIKEYVELKKSGQNWKGLCPFHPEKTPSFMVSPTKQIFHCFGCQKGGDIFSFVMNYENISFIEAVQLIADRAGFKLAELSGVSEYKKSQREKIYSINNEALNYFRKCLNESKQARLYLKERGIRDESIEKFLIGFITGEKNLLFNHLKRAGFEEYDIKQSGLVVFNGGEYQDFFKNRIIFPILDIKGRCVGFGGRTLSQSKEVPKYINSPENLIFRKSEICFGLNFAKNSISQKGYTIIVEGYFDTIMCHQYGFDNVIAPLGTALTKEQLKKIKKLSNKVLLVFDGDSAGINAAKRTLELIFSEAMISKVLMLPVGEDPDSFLRKYGAFEMLKYMGKSKTPIEFILGLYPKNIIDGVKSLLLMISLCPDGLMRDKFILDLSESSKLDESILRNELFTLVRRSLKQRNNKIEEGLLQKVTILEDFVESNKEEKILLKALLFYPQYYSSVMEKIKVDKIENSLVKSILSKINSILSTDQEFSLAKLLQISTPEEQQLITKLVFSYDIEPESADRILKDCIKAIEIREIEKKIKTETDIEVLKKLLIEKRKLMSWSSEL